MFLAEKGGFEPPVGYEPTHAFQACDLNHSSISPEFRFVFAKPPIIAIIQPKRDGFLLPSSSFTTLAASKQSIPVTAPLSTAPKSPDSPV
jgi:hypothetical protein